GTPGPTLPCCALCSEEQGASSWPFLMKAKPAVWTGKGSQQEYIAWFCTELRLCVTPHRARGGVHGCPLMTSSTELMFCGGPDEGPPRVQASCADTCSLTAWLSCAMAPPRLTTAVLPSSVTPPNV